MVIADTPFVEAQDAEELRPDTPAGTKPLESYHPHHTVRCECPVSRMALAQAVRRLANWGANVTVLDSMFLRSCPEEDPDLRSAISDAGNVIVPVGSRPLPFSSRRDPTSTVGLRIEMPLFGDSVVLEMGSPAIGPRDAEYSVELEQTGRLPDGTLKSVPALPWVIARNTLNEGSGGAAPLREALLDGTVPQLLGGLFRSARPASDEQSGGVIFVPDGGDVITGSVYASKRLLINYGVGADPDAGRYRPARLSWLLTCSEAEGKARFADKTVLIGDPGGDWHRTLVGEMPGTEVLAHATATLLQKRPLRAAAGGWVLLLMFLGAALSTALLREWPTRYSVLGIALISVGVLLLGRWLIERDVWLLTATPLAAIGAASLLTALWESGRFQSAVLQLVPQRVARVVERAGGFAVEEASVLFSDIRGYTTLSEQMDPARMMAFLNRYMGSVDDVLRRHDGHFLKSPGDCVVAWFGDERRGPRHEERVLRAGLELLANAEEFRQAWVAETGLEFAVGVGINSGPMAIGILDARRHLEPTVIGDAVNTAARIESVTKQYKTALLVSEETLAPVRDAFVAEFVDEVSVKGRAKPVRLYHVSGLTEKVGGNRKGSAR